MAKATKKRATKKGTGKELRAEARGPAAKPNKRTKRRAARPVAPPPAPLASGPGEAVLERLHGVILSRRDADPAVSHSARLLSRGAAKVAQKFGEEAVECLIEAVSGTRAALIGESADVLYHLLVMWVACGVAPEEVWAELRRREGISGIAEKASRACGLPVAMRLETTKIP